MVLLSHLKEEVISVVRPLILSDDQLQEYMEIFDQEISRGLDKETCEESTVQSIITHVNKLPTGQEQGNFLGLDFSGPVIKIVLVTLHRQNSTVTRKLYDIPIDYRSGKAERLFDFVASRIADFMKGIKLKMSRIPLGVTFGFPIQQSSLQDCKLLRWTGDFKCNDLIDKNVFIQLKDSIRKFPELKKIFVIGIISGSVSTALSCQWQDPCCMIGAVLGGRASLSYVEKVFKITKYDAEHYGIRDMYVNLESERLGEEGCLQKFLTEFDLCLDETSAHPGKLINEKLVSIDYFGELVRLILLRCLNLKLILNGDMPPTMNHRNSIHRRHLERMESDPDDDHTNCQKVLKELGFKNVTDEDCFQVQFICRCVSRRSANLVAAQLATLINRINLPKVTVAVGGELIRDYPNYKWYLTRKTKQLRREECEFSVTEAGENGLGEAVLAAVFGEEVMNRDEKLRRLPGFPMNRCQFGKGGCQNPECGLSQPVCLDNPLMKPLSAEREDVAANDCLNGDKPLAGRFGKKEGKCKECKGYDRLI